jgi:hypothetical protein
MEAMRLRRTAPAQEFAGSRVLGWPREPRFARGGLASYRLEDSFAAQDHGVGKREEKSP